jgi:hypothetical protein
LPFKEQKGDFEIIFQFLFDLFPFALFKSYCTGIYVASESTVKPVLTATPEQRPPVNNSQPG